MLFLAYMYQLGSFQANSLHTTANEGTLNNFKWQIQRFVCVYNLRGVAPDAMDIWAERGVLDTVYLHHIHRGVVHTIVFVCKFIPCWL